MMTIKPIRGNELFAQTGKSFGIIPYSYPIYKTHVYHSLSPQLRMNNTYKISVPFAFPQLWMNNTHKHFIYHSLFSQLWMNTTNKHFVYHSFPLYIQQIHTANIPPITSSIYTSYACSYIYAHCTVNLTYPMHVALNLLLEIKYLNQLKSHFCPLKS